MDDQLGLLMKGKRKDNQEERKNLTYARSLRQAILQSDLNHATCYQWEIYRLTLVAANKDLFQECHCLQLLRISHFWKAS